jgi:hypothetical protein
MKKIKNVLVLIGFLFFVSKGFALAEDVCPEKTMAEGKNIIFVGEVVDMGGDEKIFAFFDYGTSSGKYNKRTQELTLDKPQRYCIKVENLEPCTTYYYRAGMRNKAGESFGTEKEIKTECQGQVLGTTTPTQVPTGVTDKISQSLLPVLGLVFIVFALKVVFPFERFLEKIRLQRAEEKLKKAKESKG